MAPTGTPHTRLITIRGNSASGKSTLATRLRAAYGRGLAVIGQDSGLPFAAQYLGVSGDDTASSSSHRMVRTSP